MATPRSRFMRISDLVLDEDWDDATLATVIRLLAWMRQRWAKEGLTSEEAIEAVISAREAMRITRNGRMDLAPRRLLELGRIAGLSSFEASLGGPPGGRPDVGGTSGERPADVGSTSAERRSDVVWIRWPKVSEYQGWDALESGKRRPKNAPSDSRLPSPGSREEEEEEHAPSARGAAAPPARPWMRLRTLLAGGDPPAEADEREAWLEAVGQQIHDAGEAETPRAPGETEKAHTKRVNARRRTICSKRWQVYLRGPREHQGAARERALVEATRRTRERIEREAAERGPVRELPLLNVRTL